MIIEVYLRGQGEVILYSKDLMFSSDLPLGIVYCGDIYNNPLKKLFKPVDFTYKLCPNIILDGVVSLDNLKNLDNTIDYTHISISFDIEGKSMNRGVINYRSIKGYYKIHCFEVLEEKFTEFVIKRYDEIFCMLSHLSDYITCYLFKSFILKHHPKKDLQEIDFYLGSKVLANEVINKLVYDSEYL